MRNVLKMRRGYTLIELIVALGLFSIVMTLATGAYLIMIAVNQQAQATATGIDNLSFALEDMARTIRTGTAYQCGGSGGGDCAYPSGSSAITLTDSDGIPVTYSLSSDGVIDKNSDPLTDASVDVTSLQFYVSGTATEQASGDTNAPQVMMIVSGQTQGAHGSPPSSFTVQTSATMRALDL